MIGGYKDNIPKNIEFHNIDCCDFEKIKGIMKGVQMFIIVLLQLMKVCQFFLHMR